MQRETREQARAIVDGIRAEIAAEVAERQTALHTALVARIDAAEARIAAERQQALDEMRGQMENLVRAAFERLTGQQPSEQRLQQALSARLTHH